MSLEQFFDAPVEQTLQSVEEKIKQRRAQMLIHSCIYYEMDDCIISDHRWQRYADELEQLQRDNPDSCDIKFFDAEFKDWDGSTGNHLPHRHPWVYAKAKYIMDVYRKFNGDTVLP